MTRALAALLALALLGCAAAPPPPGTQVEESALLAAAMPGQATRDSLRQRFGPTTRQAFDSGVEVWLYLAPAGAGQYTELVLQFDRAGVLRQLRRRSPHPFDAAMNQSP